MFSIGEAADEMVEVALDQQSLNLEKGAFGVGGLFDLGFFFFFFSR